MTTMTINERARTVLGQVVTLHYNTCEPVGSALISKTRFVPFSPATIRNIMMKLETLGYLSQPHTSAGRLPTDLGYRAYVNDITVNRKPLDADDRKALDEKINGAAGGPHLLKAIADFLQERTKLLTFYIPFRQCGLKLKHIHFERINSEKLLALCVARGGHTFHSVMAIDDGEINASLAEKAENFFNNAFNDCNLLEIQTRINQQHGGSNEVWDVLLNKSALLINSLTQEASRLNNISFQGVSQLLDMPEFQDVGKVRILFDLLERQSNIKELVRQAIQQENEWIVFFIGGEISDPILHELTVVLSKVKSRREELGCVGVLGPKRMPYLRSLQIMAYAKENVARRDF